jgi:hypothetical protein
MLIKADPGPSHEYACLMAFIAVTNNKLGSLIIPPRSLRTKGGHRGYDMVAGGLFWQYAVSGHLESLPVSEIPLSEDGALRVFKEGVIPQARYMRGLMDVVNKNSQYFSSRQ